MTRCAVFSCLGLGDGLIALQLSYNLWLNGSLVDTFHPSLGGLAEWFPDLPISPFPKLEEIKETLSSYDLYFIIYEKSEWMQTILSYCQTHFPNQTTVLNPIATARKDYLYWEGGRFDGKSTFVDNLHTFCKETLRLSNLTKTNGITPPYPLIHRRFLDRVIIHPTSSRVGKNWPKEKYILLKNLLKSQGFHPLFTLGPQETKDWEGLGIEIFCSSSYSELATFLYESGWMIGNDSGVGHLASCLNIPTLTICRSKQTAQFWRPGWGLNEVITPPSFIPNLKKLRWRDRYWKNWISVRSVFKKFQSIVNRPFP